MIKYVFIVKTATDLVYGHVQIFKLKNNEFNNISINYCIWFKLLKHSTLKFKGIRKKYYKLG